MKNFVLLLVPMLLVSGCIGQSADRLAVDVGGLRGIPPPETESGSAPAPPPESPPTPQKSVSVLLQSARCDRVGINDAGIPQYTLYASGTAGGPIGTTFKVATSTSRDPDRVIACDSWNELDQNSFPYQNCERGEGTSETTAWTATWPQSGGSFGDKYTLRAHTNLGVEEASQSVAVTCE
jgi:hypothetical protein